MPNPSFGGKRPSVLMQSDPPTRHDNDGVDASSAGRQDSLNARQVAKLSQAELPHALGVTLSYVSQVERGERAPPR